MLSNLDQTKILLFGRGSKPLQSYNKLEILATLYGEENMSE